MKLIIDSDYEETELKSIDRCLQFLISVRRGTYPMDREFGLTWDYVDMQPLQAANALAADLAEAIPKYEDRVELDRVKMDYNDDGTLEPIIYLKKPKEAVNE
jgi:phage baseplate assembly protein W